MRRNFPWVVLAVLALGLVVGCASATLDEQQAAAEQPAWLNITVEYPWPSIASPPGDLRWSARDRLNRITYWASLDGEYDTVVMAADCRDLHYHRLDHNGTEVIERSWEIYRAWMYARQAFRTKNDPVGKADLWLSCRNELDHDP